MKFVLMPDGLSASWFRSKLAEQKVVGVKVGTFSSLLDTLREQWLLPDIEDLYEQTIKAEVLASTDSFWSKSVMVDESSTLERIDASLRFLLSSLNTSDLLSEFEQPVSRIENYYNDLVKLHQTMGNIRPIDQEYAALWVSNADEEPIEEVELIYSASLCSLELWQQTLADKLVSIIDPREQDDVLTLLVSSLEERSSHQADIQHLKQSLFQETAGEVETNPQNIRWLQCRDSLQECEVLVGMIQQLSGQGVALDDLAVVVPNGSEHDSILPPLLNKAGILSSHIDAAKTCFEWDVQLLKDLLTYCHLFSEDELVPAPLSLACILTNPLMPWSLATGQYYAERHMAGKLNSDIPRDQEAELISYLLNPKLEQWKEWLIAILDVLNFPKDARAISKKKVHTHIDDLNDIAGKSLDVDKKIYFSKLANQLFPTQVNIDVNGNSNVLNGVLLVRESECLLHKVEHLFLLGFNQGAYEPREKHKGIFEANDLAPFTQKLPDIRARKACGQQQFERGFRRFVSSANTTMTFLLSQQTGAGYKLFPSETMMDIAFCFQGKGEIKPEVLIQKISEPNNPPTFTKYAVPEENTAKVERSIDDFCLDMNLLDLHLDTEGAQRPESPSSLEKMMISPLAWLLNRQGLEPKNWKPQALDAALRGTVAHKVFELHASLDLTLTSYNDSTTYDQLFSDALNEDAPFLQEPQWCLERSQLKQEIRDALLPFCAWCESEQWTFSATEQLLTGKLWSIPLKGFVDTILKNGDRQLILDYKTSKSDRYVKRLATGYDLQTMIYRELYQQGCQQQEAAGREVMSGYYTLNDQTLVAGGVSQTSYLNHKLLNADYEAQSSGAIEIIKERIEDLRKGEIKLNRKEDLKAWGKLGVNAEYTFSDNPLVGLFMKPVEENSNDQ